MKRTMDAPVMALVNAAAGNLPVALAIGVGTWAVLHFLGKLLKQRTGVRFGAIFQVFSVAVAVLVGLKSYGSTMAEFLALTSLAELTGAFVITALVNRYFWEFYFVRTGRPAAPKFFSQVFSLVVVLAAFVLIVAINYKQAGVISTVLTTGGVLALTIGLALQDLLGNIIAGFTIHFGQPFKVGDWLILDGTHVEVMEVNWRSTRCRTNDDTYLDVPNSTITKQTVMNLYYPDRVHAIRVHVGLEYGTPPNLAKACLLRATLAAAGVREEPAPTVFLLEFGESSINYEVKAFISDHGKYPAIMDSIRTNIWYELRRKNLTIPFPQRVVEVHRSAAQAVPDLSERVMEVLKRQESFGFLTAAQLRRLAEGCEGIYFGRGERIIRQGEPGTSMFALLSGSVRVLVENEGVSTQVALIHEGGCFGEMSLLTGENRSATIVADEDALVVELGKENMGRLLKENTRVVEKLGELLARRKTTTEDQLAATVGKGKRSVPDRVRKANLLDRLKVFFEL